MHWCPTSSATSASSRHLATIKILVSPNGSHRLCGIKANLPNILHGQNGRLIKSQDELVLALTLLRHIVKVFVHPEDHHLILPGRTPRNSGYIHAIEIPVQIVDAQSELLLAAHLTACKNFTKTSQLFPGESITHRSSGLDIAFYDKVLESKDGQPVPTGYGVTRIEARFRNPKRFAESIRLARARDYVIAAIPFADLLFAFRQTIQKSLTGTLADPRPSNNKLLKPATRKILELAGAAVSLFTALAEAKQKLTHSEHGKVRREVFDKLAELHPVSLPHLLESWPQSLMAEVMNPAAEAAHAAMKIAQGWPTQGDDDVAYTFSGLLLVRKDEPTMKKWVGPEDHPFLRNLSLFNRTKDDHYHFLQYSTRQGIGA